MVQKMTHKLTSMITWINGDMPERYNEEVLRRAHVARKTGANGEPGGDIVILWHRGNIYKTQEEYHYAKNIIQEKWNKNDIFLADIEENANANNGKLSLPKYGIYISKNDIEKVYERIKLGQYDRAKNVLYNSIMKKENVPHDWTLEALDLDGSINPNLARIDFHRDRSFGGQLQIPKCMLTKPYTETADDKKIIFERIKFPLHYVRGGMHPVEYRDDMGRDGKLDMMAKFKEIIPNQFLSQSARIQSVYSEFKIGRLGIDINKKIVVGSITAGTRVKTVQTPVTGKKSIDSIKSKEIEKSEYLSKATGYDNMKNYINEHVEHFIQEAPDELLTSVGIDPSSKNHVISSIDPLVKELQSEGDACRKRHEAITEGKDKHFSQAR